MTNHFSPTATISRTFDGDAINALANDPTVRPYVGGEGVLDLAPMIANPVNFALVGGGGAFVCTQHEPGIYEVHSLFPEAARRHSVATMRAGVEYMFCRTDCFRIVTQLPDDNPEATALGKLAGFRPMFRRDGAERGPTTYSAIDIEDWAQRVGKVEGAWLHDKFEEAAPHWPDHSDDDAHLCAAGASVKLIKAGNVGKGVALYNRWARLAGYPLISLISHNPPTIDMSAGGAVFVIEVRDGEMDILLCR